MSLRLVEQHSTTISSEYIQTAVFKGEEASKYLCKIVYQHYLGIRNVGDAEYNAGIHSYSGVRDR